MARGLGAAALALATAALRATRGAGAIVLQEIAGGKCVPLPAGGKCSSVMGSPQVWQFTGTDIAALDAKLASETSFIMKAAGGVADQTCTTNYLFTICAAT